MEAGEGTMSPLELAIVIIGFGIEIVLSVVGLGYISREVRYVADIQRAILLRTDHTDKTIADIKTMLQK
jgi:hypothetical protein